MVDNEGNFVGNATESLSEAENIAVSNTLSTEVIDEYKLAGLNKNNYRPSFKDLFQTGGIPPEF